MLPSLVDILACPKCGSSLDCSPSKVDDEEVISGELKCQACRTTYPIINAIPRFVPSENYGSTFGYQWNKFRQEQIDSESSITQSERRLKTETRWDAEFLKGKWVLDAGCGAGRFLEVASREPAVNVVGVDISNAVDAARLTLSSRKNVHFIQASIYELPFRAGTFDAVYCIGVVQHTPDPLKTVASLPKVLRRGGKLALTIYERRRFTKLNSKYMARVVTRRMQDKALLLTLKCVMPVAWPVTEVLFRIPVLGKVFRFAIPIATYVDDPELTWRQRYRWALMDTFDMLSPAYDQPQTEKEVRDRLLESGIEQVERQSEVAGLNLIGTKG